MRLAFVMWVNKGGTVAEFGIPTSTMAPKARQQRVTGRSSSSPKEFLWIQIQGSPRAIKLGTSGLSDVDSFLEKVKEKVVPQLDKVPVNFLQLFLNRTAPEAFEPTCSSALFLVGAM